MFCYTLYYISAEYAFFGYILLLKWRLYIESSVLILLVDAQMKKKSNNILAGYDLIWQKGPEVKHNYSMWLWANEWGIDMINQEYTENCNYEELAEKCRKALEKSYGFAVPIPKCLGKWANTKENKWRLIKFYAELFCILKEKHIIHIFDS